VSWAVIRGRLAGQSARKLVHEKGKQMIREAMRGAVIATAVCSLFAAGNALAGEKAGGKMKEGAKVVKCAGVNECKGKGACAGADNACKAQNGCKGKGFTEEQSAKACADKGGKVVASNM
jgi:hypothetical protein